jgi:ParB/RepB/Spo0J family partition protein
MTEQTFENLALFRVRKSPDNRKRFNEAAMQELADSVRQKGVVQPILVRPIPEEAGGVKYEIVAGERRYRASMIAEVTTIPAMVRELTDAQAAEIRAIENLQREDVHPLEEAIGYEDLVKNHSYTPEQLAIKVGKSKAYIYGRMKLLALEPAARTAFFDGKLTASTALLVARIPVKALQAQAVKEITDKNDPMSAREAQEHIHDEYMLQLKSAPFKTTDATLLPKAGACTTCPKRTGNQPELFTDVESADVCTDPECFGQKRDAWSTIRIEEAKAKGQKVIEGKAAKEVYPYQHGSPQNGYKELGDKNYSDPKSRTWKQLAKAAGVEPVLVKNPYTGTLVELLKVDDLKPHHKELGLVARAGANPSNAAENERVKKAKAETAFRQRLFAAVRAKASGQMQREDWIEVALRMLARVESNDFKMLLGILGWEKDLNGYSDRDGRLRKRLNALSTEALNDLMRECALIGEVRTNSYSTGKPERLLSAATRYGVDVDAIKAQIKAEADAKKKPAAKKPVVAPVPKKPAEKKAQSKTAKPAAPEMVLNPAAAWPFPTAR